ncbi:MAG: RDD family protein [Methylacidiphilales bacterium]|nr:RDD family protein [Candidatus Methylacidiphilales bacterium]
MLPENRVFWIRGDDDKEYGPVGLEELREWVVENRAGIGTVVRLDEPDATWQPWQSYPELVALLAEVRVTEPLSGTLVIAPIFRRILAFILDMVFSSLWATPILIVMALYFIPDWCIQFGIAVGLPDPVPPPNLPQHAELAGALISDLVLVLYFTGFHAAHGRTPGKSMLRIRVVDKGGQSISLGHALLRALLVIISISAYGIPLLYAFFNPQRRTFHDVATGTYVVEV